MFNNQTNSNENISINISINNSVNSSISIKNKNDNLKKKIQIHSNKIQ